MTRPAFLSSPGVWIRAPRTAQSPADYACSVEHNVKPRSWHPAEWVFIVAFAAFIAALIFWSWT